MHPRPKETYCDECQAYYRSTKDHHRRIVHQQSVKVVYPDDTAYELGRNTANVFKCLRCTYTEPDPRKVSVRPCWASSRIIPLTHVQVHVRACYAIADVDVPQEDVPDGPVDDGFGPPPSQSLIVEAVDERPRSSQTISRRPGSFAQTPGTPVPLTNPCVRDVKDIFSPHVSVQPSPPCHSPSAALSCPPSLVSRGSHESAVSCDRRLPSPTPTVPLPPLSLPASTHLPPSSPPSTFSNAHASRFSSVAHQSPTVAHAQEEALEGSSFTPLPEECPVLPGPDTVMGGPFERWGIVVNKTHHVIICLACKRCVPRDQIVSHLRKHKVPGVAEAVVEEALRDFTLLSPKGPLVPTIPPASPFPLAIYGLDVLKDCYFCVACRRGFATRKSLVTNHFAKASAIGCPNLSREHICSTGQTFFTSNRHYIFPVTLPIVATSPSVKTPFDLFLQHVSAPAAPEFIVPPANDRTVSPYLMRLNWLPFVATVPCTRIQALVNVESDDTRWCSVLNAAKTYLRDVVKCLKQSSPDILRQMAQFNVQA